MTTIGFLHTATVHVPTFDGLTHQTWPLLGTIHAVDESLLVQAQLEGPAATESAVRTRLEQLRDHGADIICCTCSTIGNIAETADVSVPVFRVDRPMARRAVGLGPRIGVVAALESTLGPTRDLIAQEASATGTEIRLELVVADHAWSLFEAGDMDGYIRVISANALALSDRSDVIVLAQASMAPSAQQLASHSVPVLSSPSLAVEHAVKSIAAVDQSTPINM